MAIAGLGDAPLTAPRPRRVFRRGEAEITHELLGVVKTGEVPEFGHDRYCHRQLDTPQGLERLDHWGQAPRFRLGVEFLLKALEAFSMLGHRTDIFLEDDLLGGSGANDLRQPAQVGWPPAGLARITDILPQEKGFEPILRRLEVTDGIFTGATQVTNGFVFNLWDIDWGSDRPSA